MDYDDVANVSNTSSTITSSESLEKIIHDMIFTLFAIIAFTANVLIIYTTLYFKRTRVAPYIFIANWAIADLCSLLVLPSGVQLLTIVARASLPIEVHCMLVQTGSALHCAVIQFVTLVAVDWLVAAYFPSASKKLKEWYKVFLYLIWATSITIAIAASAYCWIFWIHDTVILIYLIISLLIAYLVVITIQIIRLVKKLRKKSSKYPGLAINLATAFLSCWVLSFLNTAFLFIVHYHRMLLMLSFCLIYSSSIINFCLMYRYNADFGACVRQVLSCKGIRYEEDLADDAIIQNNVVSNTVQINFYQDEEQ